MSDMVRQMRIGNIVILACREWHKYMKDSQCKGWRGSDKYARDIIELDPEPKPKQSINSARPRTAHVVGCKCEPCHPHYVPHVHGCECNSCRITRTLKLLRSI